MKSTDPRTRSRRLVVLAFILVGAGCLAFTGFAMERTRTLQSRATDIVNSMLTSIRLVARIEHDMEQARILTDDHIFERQASEMATIETKIAQLDADMARSVREYDPTATLPGERPLWDRTRAELDSIQAPMAEAIGLSRRNLDAEARQTMVGVSARFASLSRDFDELTAINNEGAAEALGGIASIRFQLRLTLLGMGFAILLVTAVVGRWAVREVTRREEQTALYSRGLEDRNRELDAFAGRVAHDLRGPLAAISLATTVLAKTSGQENETTERLRRGVHQMEALIADLLALARVETLSGSCNPAMVAAQIRDALAGRVESEKGKLKVAVEHALVRCSDGLLRQAFVNLIDNAVKYRRPGVVVEIEVSGAVRNGEYDLRVSDNGMGMSPEEAGRIFEPFYRSQRARDIPGTGLGLTIVRRIAEASGGRVSVETRIDCGTTFAVHLPLAAPGDGKEGA